ncbi:ABC transporter ATP-binding protein [Flaviaesturariibacter flavus]|uniref:ABC transporter ATP-binding protein n=1 Tax=Flaviaesturariibacter flavus TaxID=2502780 RepID=UPI001FB1C93B|nr:ABC transporter ATP-binding protein [Flaviaesturariibacter flavus]
MLRFARPYKRTFWGSIALAVVLAVLTPVRPALIDKTIREFVASGNAVWVVRITLIQIGLLLVETALRFIFSYLTSWLGQSVVKDLRVTTYRKVLGLNLRQFDRTPIGTLTTRTVDDIERINDIFADGLIPILADLLSIVAVLAYMFSTNPQLTLVCLIPFPVLIVATYYFKESVNKSFHRVRNAVSALNAFVQEHITGMYVVQAFAAEKREMNKFDAINREHRDANIHSIFAYSVFFPVVEIILATSTGLIVWFVAHPNVGVGIMTSFILCLNLLFRPLRVIADKFNTLQMGLIAGDRVFKVLDNEDVTQDTGTYAPAQVAGRIDFENVTFGYSPENTVLHNVSFSVPPGQTLAIVGHTGSGKTTIISLLNRLYEVRSGSIKIDEVPVGAWQLDALRANVGVVLQDVFLFSGSVRDNLTLRNPAIPQERVEAAAKLIGMHDFILSLPGGYDYNVMERGATLSLGQRQLLSFIRALLYNPAILVLDEATSSIDTESEALIEHAIRTLVAGRTSIIIAHRLSTIQRADQILVLDKGEVKETGTHAELLRRSGFYARLYEMQFERKINSPAGR